LLRLRAPHGYPLDERTQQKGALIFWGAVESEWFVLEFSAAAVASFLQYPFSEAE